jgi:hypothetical protein
MVSLPTLPSTAKGAAQWIGENRCLSKRRNLRSKMSLHRYMTGGIGECAGKIAALQDGYPANAGIAHATREYPRWRAKFGQCVAGLSNG